MTPHELELAGARLDELAHQEYGVGLAELLEDDFAWSGDEHAQGDLRSSDAFWRIGRLVGITVKEPFAEPVPIGLRPSQTGARRAWELRPEPLTPRHEELWQYRLMERLTAAGPVPPGLDWLPAPDAPPLERVQSFLVQAHQERGLWRVIVLRIRPHLCSDEAARRALARARPPEARSSGKVEANPIQLLADNSTSAAAGVLVTAVPWLDPSMTSVVAGVLLVVLAQGLDRFCRGTLPPPITDQVET